MTFTNTLWQIRALAWGPWTWQSNQFFSSALLGYSPYHRFCDYIEGVYPQSNLASKVPGTEGVGLEPALEGYARWFTEKLLPGCESPSPLRFITSQHPNMKPLTM